MNEKTHRKTHQKPPKRQFSQGIPSIAIQIQVFQKNMTQKDDPVVTAWVPGI